MTGAQDTLPMLLSYTLSCLSRQPDIWDRLRAEVACVGPDALTIEEARTFQLLRNIPNECTWPALPDLHDLANSDGRSSSTLSGLPCPRSRCPCGYYITHGRWLKGRYADLCPCWYKSHCRFLHSTSDRINSWPSHPYLLTQIDGILFSPGLGRI